MHFRKIGQQRVGPDLVRFFLEHLAIADNRVERRPQLVAHARKEIAFCAIRFLRAFLRFRAVPAPPACGP